MVGKIYTFMPVYSVKEGAEIGEYTPALPDINDQNFPIKRGPDKKVTGELLCYDTDMTNEEIKEDMKTKNMRPAEASELFGFGSVAEYALEQKKEGDFVVALGTQFLSLQKLSPCVLYIGIFSDGTRFLTYNIREYKSKWPAGWSFLGIHIHK